ncbi:Hypothetical protein I5071_6480 [Sandaracinus amylolyticus]|nr:Hypothetical protein I5071_6480 [Sandaracinus amylolyticus]
MPILLVGLEDERWPGSTGGIFSCDNGQLGDLGRDFFAYCEQRALHCHRKIDEFAGRHRLTGAEADLLWRYAMGIRSGDLDRAQGVGRDTKKERIASIRTKTMLDELDDVIDVALDRWL